MTTPPYWVASVPSHNNVHHGPMATAMAMSRPKATICAHCSQSFGAQQSVGPQALTPQPLGPSREHVQQNNFRFNPYQRPLFYLTCGKSGHSESRCWVRFPHLQPAWLRMPPGVVPSSDPRSVPPVPSLHSAHVAVDIIPPRSYSPVLPDAYHDNLGSSFSFQGFFFFFFFYIIT